MNFLQGHKTTKFETNLESLGRARNLLEQAKIKKYKKSILVTGRAGL
jgi:hypothetical protein